MSEISRSTLFGKLNPLAYKAVEGATVFCKLRGNPYVELVHWMQQIVQTADSDVHRIIKHFEIDPSRLAGDMTEALDRLPRGATSISRGLFNMLLASFLISFEKVAENNRVRLVAGISA